MNANLEELTTEELLQRQSLISGAGAMAAAHGADVPQSAQDEYVRISEEIKRRKAQS